MNRREFSWKVGFATGAAFAVNPVYSYIPPKGYTNKRPPVNERLFTSQAIEDVISEVKSKLKDPELAWLFENCFPNTLDTTVFYKEENGRPLTHIITGDINAMWLRDSTCQVWPYIPYANRDEKLRKMLAGLINWQAECVLVDPYANAFKKDISETTHWINDKTEMKEELHERKWEINSLLFVIRLCYKYWKITGDIEPFDETWEKSMILIYDTLREQQRFDNPGPYTFMRESTQANEVIANNGYGRPTRKIGMIHATHRQDDACVFPFYVPDNLMAVVELKHLSEMFDEIKNNKKHAGLCLEMALQIDKAIKEYAIINHKVFGEMYAFEVDGYGSHLLLEESTIPNLMSLPYVGACSMDDPVYQNTREWLLSDWNPKFVKGRLDEGIGSTHYPEPPKKIWPLSTISRALTTNDEKEILFCIEQLKRSNADTGFIHESYIPDNPKDFTRHWFSWVNTYFGEMILNLLETHPSILV
jgi:meiotically up-regulated gene 157 (Mug157) protein